MQLLRYLPEGADILAGMGLLGAHASSPASHPRSEGSTPEGRLRLSECTTGYRTEGCLPGANSADGDAMHGAPGR